MPVGLWLRTLVLTALLNDKEDPYVLVNRGVVSRNKIVNSEANYNGG